jgi:hypothetical protein
MNADKQEITIATNTGRDQSSPAENDAGTNALEQEQAAKPDDVPVRQHNPDEKGVNPDQKGPAQPDTDGD